jgi:fructokinase
MQLGAVEINKTNVICAMGNDSGEVISKTSFDITTPTETVAIIVDYFKTKRIKGLGVGLSKTLTDDWKDYNLLNELKTFFKVPVAVDAYANVALLGEASFGACKGVKNCIYVTDGDIIEYSILSSGKLLDVLEPIEFSEEMLQNLISNYRIEKIVTNNGHIVSDLVVAPKLAENTILVGALMLIRKIA